MNTTQEYNTDVPGWFGREEGSDIHSPELLAWPSDSKAQVFSMLSLRKKTGEQLWQKTGFHLFRRREAGPFLAYKKAEAEGLKA